MLPVSLTINGEAVPVFPEELIIEQTVDPNYGPGEYEFTVENHGDRAFTINSVQSELFEMNFETWSQDAMLLVYAKQENGGGIDPYSLSLAATDENMQWMPVEGCLPITIGKEPVRFKIYLMNTYEIRQQDYDINFYTDLAEAPTIVVAKVNVTDMPQIGFDKEEIVINATAADYKIEESMQISNNGNYKLTYSLRLDPTGRDEEEEIPDGGGIAPGLMNVLAPAGNAAERLQLMERNAIVAEAPIANMPIDDNPYQYDYPKGEEFTNLLYYPMLKPWNSAKSAILGTGSAVTENFYAATRFVAPEEGFNLSKLYFVGTIGDLENVDIEASVIQGGDVTSNRVMTRGKLRVEKDTPAADGGYYGTPRMLTFDREVYINPADTFYVVMKYPAGYGHSALLASRDGVKVPGRCMAYLSSMGGWIDMEELLDQEYGYGPMGYFMTCVETQPGESWIKLLDTPTEGEVAVGESATVKFSIDASRAYFDKDNRATLVIKSNDPMSKLVNYHVTLNKNAAPVVTAPEGTISVSEGSSAIIPLTIADEEGDAFTVALGENNGEAVISSFTNAEGTQDGVTEADGVISVAAGKSLKLHVTVSADYETAGLHTLVVEAADELGNSNSASILYNVEHTNRAPEYIGVEEIDVTVGESSDVFEYATLFNDPDDDEMTYSVAASNTAIISVFDSATGFIIKGNKVATTTVRITATDALGAATTKSVSVNVKKADSIDDITTGNGGLLTDINGDNLSITLGKDVENASFMVCDAAGRILSRREATGMKAGETISLGLGEAPVRSTFSQPCLMVKAS